MRRHHQVKRNFSVTGVSEGRNVSHLKFLTKAVFSGLYCFTFIAMFKAKDRKYRE